MYTYSSCIHILLIHTTELYVHILLMYTYSSCITFLKKYAKHVKCLFHNVLKFFGIFSYLNQSNKYFTGNQMQFYLYFLSIMFAIFYVINKYYKIVVF